MSKNLINVKYLIAVLLLSIFNLYATEPEISYNIPNQVDITVNRGESVNFSFNATDIDGNISGSEWYGHGDNPYIQRVGETSGNGSNTNFNRSHTFVQDGDYKIVGMAYDRNYEYSNHITWNVTVIDDHSSTPVSNMGGRALYVDDFEVVLASQENTARLLSFIQAHNITKLTIYDLHTVLLDRNKETPIFRWIQSGRVSNFIKSARNVGVTSIGAAGGSKADFDRIMIHQRGNAWDGKFDTLYLEYEYWNNGSDINTFVSLLDYMNNVGGSMEVETYLGWLDDADYAPIASRVDNIFLHCYVTDAASAFDYCEDRLKKFVELDLGVNIWPLLSSEWRPTSSCDDSPSTEGALCFMGKWLEQNGIAAAEQAFMDAYNTDSAQWKQQINIQGMHYFAYTFLDAEVGSTDDPINLLAPTFSSIMPTNFYIGAGETITFDATAIDSQGNLSGLDWDLYTILSRRQNSINVASQSSVDVEGDGDSANFTVTYSFENPGTYIMSATAYDSNGNKSRPIYSTVKVN